MAVKRFLHIMPDDKFLDYFIKQSEEVAAGASVYWVKLNKTERPQFVKSELVEYFLWNSKSNKELVDYANQFEKVFLHSFTLNMTDFILSLRPSLNISWMFWGYDGYGYTSNEKKWLLPATWLIRKDLFRKNNLGIRHLYHALKVKYRGIKDSRNTKKILRRINCCATWVKYDYEMIRHINPSMIWADYNYFSFNELGLDTMERKGNNYSNIWVGNSAALTNNHADTLSELKKLNWQGNIYMPLSYGGSPGYREEIIRLGRTLFGENFHPITNFVPLLEYQQLINQCGIIWMNHIRQQAAGNILAALYMGKAVILHPASNLYKTLKEWNIKLYASYTDLAGTDIKNEAFDINKEIVKKHLTYQRTLDCVRHLYVGATLETGIKKNKN